MAHHLQRDLSARQWEQRPPQGVRAATAVKPTAETWLGYAVRAAEI